MLYLFDVSGDAVVSNLNIDNVKSHQNTYGCYLYPLVLDACAIYNISITNSEFSNLRSGIVALNNANAIVRRMYIANIEHDSFSACKIYNPYNVPIDRFYSEIPSELYGIEIPLCNRATIPRCTRVSDSLPNEPVYYNQGDIISIPDASGIGYKCTVSGTRYTNYRAASTAYTRGTIRKYEDYLLVCTFAGTTSEESTIVPTENVEVQDGTCYWRVLFKGNAQFEAI